MEAGRITQVGALRASHSLECQKSVEKLGWCSALLPLLVFGEYLSRRLMYCCLAVNDDCSQSNFLWSIWYSSRRSQRDLQIHGPDRHFKRNLKAENCTRTVVGFSILSSNTHKCSKMYFERLREDEKELISTD